AAGHREIVLTGVHLGHYGRDLAGRPTLAALLRALLEGTAVERLRLSSIEINEVTDELLALMAGSPRLMPHLHVPLQAGDDTVLAAMRRQYHTAFFARRLGEARRALGDLGVTTDLIVGFPGEDERAFRRGLDFVAECGFSRVHLFPYSVRAGTRAAEMPGRNSPQTIARRRREMAAVARGAARAYHARQIGAVRPVLVEAPGAGYTDTYVRVLLPAPPGAAAGDLLPVRLVAVASRGDAMIGEVEIPCRSEANAAAG
ncbi:MAG: radical SAM protein, partial [Planctomycetes bacterium]|nr:radical SAM protein [Planctomycetota bacterium]